MPVPKPKKKKATNEVIKYDIICEECGEIFEHFKRKTGKKKTACPDCERFKQRKHQAAYNLRRKNAR